MTQDIVLVAAMARRRAIGRDGGMPWHLPADLRHFKAVTLGHPVIMGRRTFESIGRPLPGRLNVVISRRRPELPEGVELAAGLDQALSVCREHERVMVIGGGEIYAQALAVATHMELTFIDADVEADTHFPAWPTEQWQLESMAVRAADDANPFPLSFCSFCRRPQP
ncbi:dihydrofolate reductase [Wenzhouxiangella sp. AB-CW3]|uniref:dihydrofolate reductase n=1 Tax=Wenzhouxiangella sp. AB-CW3 TaxID=2771012 RepID=UPI00168AF096|nr:dihydrofolate reductase [Wenzhouxiangella sp. AB-CW3]QOC22342.1 dihydrofolate reductase [Wenzhouxiangella sp. AB-CW3]